MCRSWFVFSIIFTALLAGSGPALANNCSALESQMQAAMSASSVQATQIRRQIAAIRATEKRQSCTTEKASGGGLFNACRGLAWQRADAERSLAAAQGGSRNMVSLRARYRALGCETRSARQESKPETSRRSDRSYAGNTLFYCVRLADGYLFPAPKSQFAKKNYPEIALDQCRFICNDPAMALYVHEDPELETAEMVSVETRTPYRELSTAFHYQGEAFEACDWPRYFSRVNELRARTVTPRNLDNAIIPIPKFRPEQQDSLRTASLKRDDDLEAVDRDVRVVGPIFLPDKKTNFREINRRTNEERALPARR